MRARYLLILVVPAVALLALGAIPAMLGGGEIYHVTATVVDEPLAQAEPANASEAIPAANLSTTRFPYTTAAIADGKSDPYEEGRFGVKEAFTHTPFDEFRELEVWNREAVDGDAAFVSDNGTYYRLEITSEGDE